MALVKLDEYFKLIAEEGQIREYLFESNVRDYEGDVEVNKQIRSTLQSPQAGIDFWWLNNGITIVAENVTGHSGELVLDDPQIVNGLQTSQVIFDCLREPTLFGRATLGHILVRIIKSNDDQLRDRIIRATNSQTKIPVQYLRASDDKQRDIELFFKSSGLHYDRRKNSWRKTGLKLESVVGVTELVQSVAAIIRQEPDHARARPSRYFIDEHYDKIFNENIPMGTYVVCALLRKRAERFLKRIEADRKDRNNLLFYVLMALKPVILHKKLKFQEVDIEKVTDDDFKTAHSIVSPIYARHGTDDKAAKGVEMLADLKAELKTRFGRKKKSAPSAPH